MAEEPMTHHHVHIQDFLGETGKPLHVHLVRQGDAWLHAFAFRPRWNGACHGVDTSGLEVDDDTIMGSLTLHLRPDRWIPKDRSTSTLEVPIDSSLTRTAVQRPATARFMLICESSTAARRVLTLTLDPQGPADGRWFSADGDGPADLSKLRLEQLGIGGSLHFGETAISMQGIRIGEHIGGTFTADEDQGTLIGNIVGSPPIVSLSDPAASVRILLPPGYEDGDTRYPLVLHGGAMSGMDAMRALMQSGAVPPIIYAETEWSQTLDIDGLLAHIDATYRTIPGDRTAIGFSAGCHHLYRLMFRYPDRFDRFVLMSHPLRASGKSDQKASEYEAARSGAADLRKHAPRILLLAGSQERSQRRGMALAAKQLRDEWNIACDHWETPGVGHHYEKHLKKAATKIVAWIQATPEQ